MIMKTKRFTLRPVRLEDAENICKYQQESEIKKNFMCVPKNMREARKDVKAKIKDNNLDKTKRKSYNFVIDINGKAIGEIGLHDIIYGHKATSNSWIAKPFRGKNIATEARRLLVKYAFKTYNLKRLEANVRTFNKASARVLEKAGYKLEGILRKNKYKNGKYLDDMVWAIVK